MASDATNPVDSLMAIAPSITTQSTTRRIQIFRRQIPSILNTSAEFVFSPPICSWKFGTSRLSGNHRIVVDRIHINADSSQMTTEFVSLLVDLLFQTLSIYDDRGSRKAVDDVIIKALSEAVFLKSFAASLVQAMERHSKFQSLTGSYRLLQWSCLLLIYSQFASLSKNALCRVAQAQASVLHIVMQGPSRLRRACSRTLFSLFTKSPDIHKTYMEELKDGRIPYKDSPELIHLMLDYLSTNPASFDKWKASDEEKYDLVREGVVIFTGALAKHLSKGDPKVHAVVEKLLDVLNTPSETVQRAVSSCLSPLMQSKQASIRRSSSYLIGYFFQNSKLYLVDEAPNMISTLIVLLSDPDSATVAVAWEALLRVVNSVPKEVLPSYIKLVRDAVSTSRDKERRKKKGGPVLIPGFALPKALQPVLPIFLQGLISGSAELREQAALGLGELIEVTSEKALKEFVIPITGPLIRIIGDRFPWQVKSAILSTLSIMIQKGGIALKPFLPQLQTTFVKCLQDNTRTVRSSAAFALGKLSALSTRIDPLVGDLLSGLQASDLAIREAILTALEGVIKNAGKSLSSVVITRVHTQLNDIIYSEDDQIRSSAASILGILLQYLENAQISEVLTGVTGSASSTWTTRHGSILAIASMLRHNAAIVCASPLFTSIIECLRSSMKDEKFPVRESSVRALGRLFLYQIRNDPSNTAAHVATLNYLVLAMQDDSSEVRRRALNALKAVAKANPQGLIIHTSIFGPALAECLKDGSTPVRLAAERCALHSFQLSKGTEYVQAAQKYITGLDARRISKLPEHSDDSEESEDEASG
ncbi:UNVERIFIED_CONTAM: protein ILITYHIA [Sesamum radiatum]|uniref:Protein ILITYHIA n=1 Tax=Sesamum radiatum TaxID=300843 RepID=A0AAW2K9U6_SESRA